MATRAPRVCGLVARRQLLLPAPLARASACRMDRHRSTRSGRHVPPLLRERARARVDGGWVRRVGDGDVLGAVLVLFGLGGGE